MAFRNTWYSPSAIVAPSDPITDPLWPCAGTGRGGAAAAVETKQFIHYDKIKYERQYH